jgi:hypothetical protein
MATYLPEAQTGPDNATALPEEMSPRMADSDEAILRALEKFSFSSVRHLFCAIHLLKTTVSEILREAQVYGASSPIRATDPV